VARHAPVRLDASPRQPKKGGVIIRPKSMVVYNAASKELTAKIVYYGPGFGGKTTNLQFLHRRLEPSSVGNLLTLAATADRTIFFDLLPVELGDLKGYRIRFQVATVPGQSPYNETRRVVLRGADGIVLVVDSRWSQLPKNLESLQNLRDNLKEEGIDPATIPFAVQFNKRDLPDVLAIDALQEGLGLAGFPFIEAVASEGKGVVETFKLISKLTFVDILRRLQKKGTPKAARPAPTETENLSAWKSSIVHGKSALAPEPGAPTHRSAGPEPLAFPEPEDAGITRAIPTLVRPVAVPAAVTVSEPPPSPAPPFAFDEEEAAAPAAPERARDDAVVFETFPPSPEPAGVTEDTNPAFFERRPAGAPAPMEFPVSADRASPAAFATPEPLAVPETEITAPMTFPVRDAAVSAEAVESAPPAEEAAGAPERVPAEPAAPGGSSSASDAAAERLDRMIQLAVASTWGDRLSAAEEKLAALATLEERIAGVETGLASHEGTAAQLSSLDARLGTVERARGWAKDVDLLRTDWANVRLASEGQIADLRKSVTEVRQSLAEGSGREMELVAQVSRETLSTAAAIERLGFRIQETEEKFSQLVVDQESRLARLERLVDEQSAHAASDREAGKRSLLELEERLRALRDEGEENRRRAAAEVEETVRRAREDFDRQRSSGDELRRFLADGLAELAARLRGSEPPSS